MRAALLVPCLLMISCKQTDYEYIRKNSWEYDNGFRIGQGDFLTFDTVHKVFDLRNNIILYNGQPKAIINKLDKRYFELTISSLDGKKNGAYVAEAEHRQ